MISISICSSSPHLLLRTNPHSFLSFPSNLSSPSLQTLKTRSEIAISRSGDAGDPTLLRKPLISSSENGISMEKADFSEISDDEEKGYEWVDWEDQILEDTVPLVGFVRMILHSRTYESGGRLSAKHEKTILERLLPYHPEFEEKTGCGIDYIAIGNHPDFENSRCLFIVRKDGELVDFSYWKCIKGLIRKNYPLYADTFLLRHFRPPRRGE